MKEGGEVGGGREDRDRGAGEGGWMMRGFGRKGGADGRGLDAIAGNWRFRDGQSGGGDSGAGVGGKGTARGEIQWGGVACRFPFRIPCQYSRQYSFGRKF